MDWRKADGNVASKGQKISFCIGVALLIAAMILMFVAAKMPEGLGQLGMIVLILVSAIGGIACMAISQAPDQYRTYE